MKNQKTKQIVSKSEMMAIKNAITGEMETAKVTVTIAKDVPKYKGEPFTMLFQVVNLFLVKEMPPADCKVLLYLVSMVKYGNIIDRTIKEIAEDLGYKDSQWIQKSLKNLQEKKIILTSKHPQDKRRLVYMINPLHSWKGTVKDRVKTLSFYDTKQLSIFDKDSDNEVLELPVEKIKKQKQALPSNYDFLSETPIK